MRGSGCCGMRNQSYAISAITEHAPCLTGLPSRQVGEDPTCQGPTESTWPAPSSLTGGSTRRWGSRRSFCSLIRSTGHPLPRSLAVVEAAEKLGVRLQLEFTQCQVETTSPVCGHTHELRTGLAEMRSAAANAAAQCGARLLAVGVPVLGSAVLPITDIRRFRTIASRFGYLAGTRGVCAGHVHVGVPDRGNRGAGRQLFASVATGPAGPDCQFPHPPRRRYRVCELAVDNALAVALFGAAAVVRLGRALRRASCGRDGRVRCHPRRGDDQLGCSAVGSSADRRGESQ